MRPPASTRSHFALTFIALSILCALAGCSGSARRAAPGASTTASAPTSTSRQPTTTTRACRTTDVLASWTLARLAAQTIVVPVQESDVAAVAQEVASGVGGVILFGASAPADLARQLSDLRASAPRGVAPFVMADEEGGAVQRMANLVGSVPSAREMGATMTPAEIEQTARVLALRMRAVGVTMDLAPVLDVDGGPGPDDRDPDGSRSFSANEVTASADARAFAAGLGAGGVIAVAKHFPGLGSASGNTDVTPATTQPWSDLQRVGLVPFADAVAARVPAIMVANAVVPGLTTLPAGISPTAITGVLRDRLGYDGLVLTDSLSAAALRDIGYAVPRAATAALSAGADMFLSEETDPGVVTTQTVDAIVTAVRDGRISRSRLENAVAHIVTAKGIDLCAAP